MKVLLAVASRHGATLEIADRIGARLGGHGLEVTIQPASSVSSVDGYDAVIVGSAVYVGRWLEDARQLIDRLGPELRGRPVWLFSSGPIGDPPKPEADPVDVALLADAIGARGHQLFAGRLDRQRLGLGERAVVALVKAPEGDYRDWAQVDAWAAQVAAALALPSAV